MLYDNNKLNIYAKYFIRFTIDLIKNKFFLISFSTFFFVMSLRHATLRHATLRRTIGLKRWLFVLVITNPGIKPEIFHTKKQECASPFYHLPPFLLR